MTTISTQSAKPVAPEHVAVLNPVTGEVVGQVPVTPAQRVPEVVQQARGAVAYWAHTRLTDRHMIYRQFVKSLRDEREALAALLTAETGQPLADSRGEVDEAAGYFFDTIGESNAFYGQVYPHGAEAITASFLQYTVNEPLGVVAVVMDDQSPVISLAYQVASTLLVGNVVVVRPGTLAPLAVLRVVELLHLAGVPAAALQVVGGGGEVVLPLVADPGLNGLSFHGTSEDAVAVTQAARQNLTRVVALGNSNDAVIVFDDADLDAAVADIVRAGFANAGQNRTAPKRVLVQEAVRAAFTERLVAAAGGLLPGNPFDADTRLGSLASEDAANAVAVRIADAVAAGARLLVGGVARGAAVTATVLDLPDASHPLARDAVIRGPVLAIVGFVADRDAYSIVNSSPFGIGAGVFTSNLQRAGAAAGRLHVTAVVVNGAGDYRGRRIPFGGVKTSGVGSESLLATPREVTETKTILAADVYDFAAVNENNVAGRHT